MKYLVSILMATALLSGCKTRVEGQLNVTKDIKLRAFSGEKHNIAVGTYTADLSPNGSERIALRLNNDKNERFNFAIPSDVKIPDNGTLNLTSAQVNQAADVNINVVTVVTKSDIREEMTSCTYQMPVQRCYPTPGGGVQCSIYYETVFGQQWERFYNVITTKDLTLNLSEPAATESSAQFIGSSQTFRRVILGQSPCR